jgi:hypothetical protein
MRPGSTTAHGCTWVATVAECAELHRACIDTKPMMLLCYGRLHQLSTGLLSAVALNAHGNEDCEQRCQDASTECSHSTRARVIKEARHVGLRPLELRTVASFCNQCPLQVPIPLCASKGHNYALRQSINASSNKDARISRLQYVMYTTLAGPPLTVSTSLLSCAACHGRILEYKYEVRRKEPLGGGRPHHQLALAG